MIADGVADIELPEMPKADAWVQLCLDAFYVLNMQRVNGVIPLTDVKAYMDIYEVPDKVEFLSMFHTINIAYIEAIKQKHGNKH